MEGGGPAQAVPAAHTMARKQAQPSDAPTEARALCDIPDLGVAAGRLLQADPLTVSGLVAAGKADPHPDAVAYAKAQAAQEP